MMKMYENENMERFIAEQRNQLAHDKQILEKNPTSAVSDYIMDEDATKKKIIHKDEAVVVPVDISTKENVFKRKPPTPQLFKLGEAYKKHKEKLKEELRLEYRQALAEKQVRTTGVRGKMQTKYDAQLNSDDLGLSLPIRDHLSAKERLRLERSREYNEFKASKENEAKHKSPRRLQTLATPITVHEPRVNESTQTAPPAPKGRIEESYQELLDRKRQEERAYRHVDIPDDGIVHRAPRQHDDAEDHYQTKRVGFSKKRRPRLVEYYYDDEDDEDETEEELIERLRARRGRKILVPADDGDDDVLFERIRRKEELRPKERRRSIEDKAVKEVTNRENDLRSRSAPPDQLFTGLPIGKVPSANTVQRKKDQYKLELTQQMEADRQRKIREKRLDKQSEPSQTDKQANASKPPRGKKQKVESPPDSDEERKVSKRKKGSKKTSMQRLDSSDSEEDIGGRGWASRPRYPPYYAPSMMSGYYPPPPVAYPSPYDEAYRYYGTQNPLNAAMPPVPFLDPSQRTLQAELSPLLAAAESKIGNDAEKPSKPAENRNFQKHKTRSDANKSSLVSDETRDTHKKRDMMQAYQEELKVQMRMKEKKKEEQKLEQEQYDKKKELEAAHYNPWGKGGGGAPMKDTHGNLISDLRSMHIQNEDLIRDPSKVLELAKQRQKAIQNTEEIFQTPRKDTEGFDNSPHHFGRSNPFEEKLTVEQRTQKDTYKDELRKQIEEKRRYDAERKEQLRLLEEKEERKMVEDARKMQEEYENEQKKQRDKILEQQRKNEEIQKALEENRKEEERKRKEERRKREEEERLEKDKELDEKLRSQGVSPRVRTQERGPATPLSVVAQHAPTPKQVYSTTSHHEVAVQASQTVPRSYNPSPAPTRAPQVPQSRESKRISRELSALRKQLLNEQQRIEHQLRVADSFEYPLSGYPRPRKPETIVDLTARQRPVQVRRPPTVDRPNSKALREFSEFKNKQDDTTSLRMFRIQHPDTPEDTSALMQQQEDLIKSQLMKIEALKSNLEQPQASRRSTNELAQDYGLLPADSYTSLLETETTYIPVPENEYPPAALQSREKRSSARERRRNRRQEEGSATYRATPDNFSAQSLNSLASMDIDRLANKNQNRLDQLKTLQGDDVSLTDPDDILDRFVNQQNAELPNTPDTFNIQSRRPRKGTSVSAPQQDRPPSVNTVDTEPWLRPGTGPAATGT